MARFAVIFTLLLGVTACDPYTNTMMLSATVVSVVNTDKTIGDHLAGWAMNEDCSSLRASKGDDYCRPWLTDEEIAQAERDAKGSPQYCYRSLGGIACYTEADKDASPETRVQ